MIQLPARFVPPIDVLGQGGFATVYRAHDQLTGEQVAVKVPFRGANKDLAREMAAELRAMASLRHPNIVQVLDAGAGPEGSPFLVMEYASGGSLAGMLDGRPPDWPGLLPLLLGILRGLGHAHAQGIVHRDVKPENVLLSPGPDGRLVPRLSDFGLAKILDRKGDWNSTRMGAGTVAYMAPEQFSTDTSSLHPSADLYAFGVLVYGLVAGRLPWVGDSVVSLLYAKADGDTPELVPRVGYPIPPGLDGIVRRLLDRSPPRRYQLAADVALALQSLEPTARPSTPERRWTALDRAPGSDAPPSPPPSAALAAVRPPLLVDRDEARGALLTAAREGADRPTAIALAGPSGIGRSRLARWLCATLEERGLARPLHLALVGRVSPAEALVRELRRLLGLGRLVGLELRERLAEYLQTVEAPARPDLDALCFWLDPAGSGAQARTVADAGAFAGVVVRLLRAEARRGLACIWIEDDAGTGPGAALATELLRGARADGFGLVVLLDGVERADEAPEGFRALPVQPLAAHDAEALLEDILPRRVGGSRRLLEQGKGRPALLVELARLAARESSVPESGPGLKPVRTVSPESSAPTISIRDVARARVDGFLAEHEEPGNAELLLQILALLPRPSPREVVGRVFEHACSEPEAHPGAVVDEARAAGLLRATGDDRLDFDGPALAEAARRLVPEARSAALRRACADGILGCGPTAADRARAGSLLREAGEPGAALDVLVEAGEELLRLDLDAARGALRSAVQAAEEAGLDPTDGPALRARLGLARAERNSGAPADSMKTLDPLLGAELSPRDRGALLAIRASVLLQQGALDDAAQAARTSLELGQDGDEGSLAPAAWILGEVLFRQGRREEAEDELRRSLSFALAAGANEDRLAAAWRLARVQRARGQTALARESFDGVLELAREQRDARVAGIALRELGNLALMSGEAERARELLADSIDHLERAGQRVEALGTRVSLGELARSENRLQDARREYSTALAGARAYGLPHTSCVVLINLAMTELAMHKPVRAARRVDALDGLVPPSSPSRLRPWIEAVRLAVLCARNDAAEAEATLDALLEQSPPPDGDLMGLLERAGDLAGQHGEVALATDILEVALEQASGLGDADAEGRIRGRMGRLVGT